LQESGEILGTTVTGLGKLSHYVKEKVSVKITASLKGKTLESGFLAVPPK